MAAFKKYEKILNKKRKREAFINLLTDETDENFSKVPKFEFKIEDVETKKKTKSNITNEEMQCAIKEAKKFGCYTRKIEKERMMQPKLFLNEIGEFSCLNIEEEISKPLNFADLRKFISFAVAQPRPKLQPKWCTLLRRYCLKQVVLVIIDGVGVLELKTLREVQNASKVSEESNNNSNLHISQECDPRKPPGWFKESLPHSASLFGLHLLIETPTPDREEIFVGKLGGIHAGEPCIIEEDESKTAEGTPNNSTVLEGIIESTTVEGNLPTESTTVEGNLPTESTTVEGNLPTESTVDGNKSIDLITLLTKEIEPSACDKLTLPALPGGHQDNYSRLKLILNHEDLARFGYPLNVEGGVGFNDPKFQPTHEVYDKVHDRSPMFGVDCEMCMTAEGTELTSVSVVDENLAIVYSKLVTPESKITNYLTQYSGITKELLANVTTTLKDVQIGLRNILPKDAILVGHQLDADLCALKLFHPYCIDTCRIYNLTGQRRVCTKLKHLAKLFLGKSIQMEDRVGHDADEDATATIELALLKLRKDPSFGDVVKSGNIPFSLQEQSNIIQQLHKRRPAFLQHRPYQKELGHEFNKKKLKLITNLKLRPIEHTCDAAYVGMESCSQKESDIFDVLRVSTVLEVSSMENVFRKGSELKDLQESVLVLHVKVAVEFHDSEPKTSERELELLDQELKSLHERLPQNAMLITLFTGSPKYIPEEQPANAILLIDIIGEDKMNFYRHKK